MQRQSRREFFSTVVALFAGKPLLHAFLTPPLADCTFVLDPVRSGPTLSDAIEDCPECAGFAKLVCPACDGTRMWTEASESAGLYQREAARHAGHCAFCDEWGEAICPQCEGTGVRQPEENYLRR